MNFKTFIAQLTIIKENFSQNQLFKKIYSYRKINKTIIYLLPILVFSIVSLILFGPRQLSDFSHKIFDPSGDSYSFIWFLNYLPFAINHNKNLFLTKYVFYPRGYNLSWSTMILGLGILIYSTYAKSVRSNL